MYNNGETKPFVPQQTEIVKSGGGGGGQLNYQLFFSTFYYSTHLCLEKLPPRPSHPSAHISPVAVKGGGRKIRPRCFAWRSVCCLYLLVKRQPEPHIWYFLFSGPMFPKLFNMSTRQLFYIKIVI